MKEIAEKLIASLSPQQVCWMCLLVTAGLATFSVRTFADNGKVEAVEDRVLTMQIFDLRIRQCMAMRQGQSGELYERLLAEPLETYSRKHPGYRVPRCEAL